MTVALPPAPARVARLPKDAHGYPVPWFVQWMADGKPTSANFAGAEPDFRVIDSAKLGAAVRSSLCWICGGPLGVHRVFAIGPMCVVNRVTSEPPSHRACAEYAAKACPFLSRPRMRRNEKDLPEDRVTAGIPIDRNPGACALYETRKASPFRSGDGCLFRLGEPDRIDWWADGRPAARAEVWASIESGYPLLLNLAKQDGPRAIAELERLRDRAMELLPAA
jgi:hypothetical protein